MAKRHQQLLQSIQSAMELDEVCSVWLAFEARIANAMLWEKHTCIVNSNRSIHVSRCEWLGEGAVFDGF